MDDKEDREVLAEFGVPPEAWECEVCGEVIDGRTKKCANDYCPLDE